LQYIHSDWRSWLSIAIGVYFLVRGYLTFRSSAPRQ
jgi:hypothetical protein